MTRPASLFAAPPALAPAFLRAHMRCVTPAQGQRWFLGEHAVRGDGIVLWVFAAVRFCRGLIPLAPVNEREGCHVALLEDGCRDHRLLGLLLPSSPSTSPSARSLRRLCQTALLAHAVSVLFVLLSRTLFVVNLTSAIVWLRRPASATTTLSVCFAAYCLRRSVQGFHRARGSLSRRP